MLPITHFLVSIIVVIALFPFFGPYSFIALIGGVLIDVDHLIFYMIKNKKLDLKKTYTHFRNIGIENNRKEYKNTLLVFHSFELMAILAIISFYNQIIFILFIGMLIHIVMDETYCYPKFKTFAPLSIVYYLKNVKKQNKK